MEMLFGKFVFLLYGLAEWVAAISVNTTCSYKFYQEKTDAQLNVLKKYSDR